MSNLLCKIGLHNWKDLDIASVEQLEACVRTEIKQENRKDDRPCCPECVIYEEGSFRGYKHKKICRRCEKISDTITPYKIKIKPKVLRELELEEIGK